MATKAQLAEVAREQRAKTAAMAEEGAEVTTALTTVATTTGAEGVMSIALLSDEDFEQHLELLQKVSSRIQSAMRSYMELDTDYGTIPGTPKPTLLKPGAEKLLQLFGLAAETETRLTMGDGVNAPSVTYDAITYIHRGSFAGPVVATGHGTANSWEKRYRREAPKACPNCGKAAIIKSKAEYGGGWYCWPKKGGCDSKFADDDERMAADATTATGDSGTAFDLANTLVKMASKRSLVDGTLRATASSGLFAQDLAEEAEPKPETTTRPAVAQRPAPEPEVRVRRDAPPARLPQEQREMDQAAAGFDESVHGPSQGTADDGEDLMEKVLSATGGTEVIDIGPSAAGETERGGRTANANTAQIEEVRRLASQLRWGAKRLLGHVNEILGIEDDTPANATAAKAALEERLEGLLAMEIGAIITDMRSQLDADLPA